MSFWKIKEKESHFINLEDPDGWYSASVKYNKSVHFFQYYNVPLQSRKEPDNELSDYLYISDIDDLIQRLTELKEIANKHFE